MTLEKLAQRRVVREYEATEPIYDNHETAWFIENSEGEQVFQESPYLKELKWTLAELRAKNKKETYKVMRVERYTAIFEENC